MESRVGLVARGLRGVSACGRLVVALLAWASLTVPRQASACSIALPPVALVGAPMDGDTDVALDVVPFYDINRARLSDPSAAVFDLADANGAPVPFSVRADSAWHVELVPELELAADTEYVLRARSEGEELRLRFVTGSRRAAPPEAPTAAISHYLLDQPELSSCSPPRASSCISFEASRPVLMETSGSSYLLTQPIFYDLSGIDQGTSEECVRLRQRAENGQLSEPTELCRDDGPLRVLVGSEDLTCDDAGITQSRAQVPTGGEATPDGESGEPKTSTAAGGCSLAARPRAGLSGSLGLTVLLLLRRSRARR